MFRPLKDHNHHHHQYQLQHDSWVQSTYKYPILTGKGWRKAEYQKRSITDWIIFVILPVYITNIPVVLKPFYLLTLTKLQHANTICKTESWILQKKVHVSCLVVLPYDDRLKVETCCIKLYMRVVFWVFIYIIIKRVAARTSPTRCRAYYLYKMGYADGHCTFPVKFMAHIERFLFATLRLVSFSGK